MKGFFLITMLSAATIIIYAVALSSYFNTSYDGLRRFLESESNEIPKIVHFMVLGSQEYINQAAEFHEEYIKSTYPEFVVKVWRDEDAEQLIQEQNDEGISSAWEAIKRSPSQLRNAKMADFMRVLIMYTVGGVYLDVDMVPCAGLEELVKEPGLVSFPFTLPRSIEINGAGMSSPKGHELFERALDTCVQKGDELATLNNLDACGPRVMAIVVDRYIEEKLERDNLSLDIPHFSNLEYNNYNITDDLVRKENGWMYIADIKYRDHGLGIHHLHFCSWHGVNDDRYQCIQHPEKVKPFLNWMCVNKRAANFRECGIVNQM